MRLPRFEYLEPRTIEEACAFLSQDGTAVIAGGTDLLVKLKQRVVTPRTLVNIKHIPYLDHIEQMPDGGLSIGATTTLRTVASSSLVKKRFGMLAKAAASVGKPRIPETATLGGNICLDSRCFYYNQSHLWKQSLPRCYKDGGDLCHVVKGGDHCNALFVADTVPALIALEAKVTVADTGGDRQIPLEDFYARQGERVNVLRPGQVLTSVELPAPSPRSGSVYLKHSLREAIDFAVVSVGVRIVRSPEDGVCTDARVVLGSVATGPVRLTGADAALRGKVVDEESAKIVGRLAAREAHPFNHLGVSAAYKRRMIEILTKRAVTQAFDQAAATQD